MARKRSNRLYKPSKRANKPIRPKKGGKKFKLKMNVFDNGCPECCSKCNKQVECENNCALLDCVCTFCTHSPLKGKEIDRYTV